MEATTADSRATVISIAAGEAHTLALTGDGRVYSWGRGLFGRLGTGSEKDELSPVEVNFGISQASDGHSTIKFVAVSAGSYHSLALAGDGSVWSWGYNIDGQLGFDGDNSATPCLLKEFFTDESILKSESPLKIRNVEAGGMMSAAIDNLGGLWIWGNCPHRSSDAEDGFRFERSYAPNPVGDFSGRGVAKVACGSEHVVALVGGGDPSVYSWGNNRHGQLGLGDTESRARPEIVRAEPTWSEVHEVACGGFHTALLAGSDCWTFGLGENGQLGHGTTRSSAEPRRVAGLPGGARLVSVGCGLFHTSVASDSGGVWSWGMERGLGLCPDARVGAESGDAIAPLAVATPGDGAGFAGPVQIVCGAAYTVLLARDGGELWSWGRGRSGVLGTGKTEDCLNPTPVWWPEIARERVNAAVEESQRSDGGGEGDAEDRRERRASAMERYASVLHRSIFGKPIEERDIAELESGSGDFEVGKEWERMLEKASREKLVGLEMFYRSMLSGVEDQLMKRRIKEAVKECLTSFANKS